MRITDLKERAKNSLSINYWLTIGVSVVFTTLVGARPATFFSTDYKISDLDIFDNFDTEASAYMLGIVFILSLISIALATIQIVIYGPLSVGYYRYNIKKSRGENARFADLFSGFRHFGKNCAAGVLVSLYTFLWSLLFLIPGIVKSYSYSMTFYLLADNSYLSPNEAITQSREIMDGKKGKLFVLDLSFIGWYILNIFTFGLLGLFYITPYHNLTKSEFYCDIVDIDKNTTYNTEKEI